MFDVALSSVGATFAHATSFDENCPPEHRWVSSLTVQQKALKCNYDQIFTP